MRDVHYVLHAPQGDTYADLLFTMIERQDKRPPVTYTTFQARDLGGDTAGLVTTAVAEAAAEARASSGAYGARPRPLAGRSTDEERARHAAFIRDGVKNDALWAPFGL
jgi:hypothetical protein